MVFVCGVNKSSRVSVFTLDFGDKTEPSSILFPERFVKDDIDLIGYAPSHSSDRVLVVVRERGGELNLIVLEDAHGEASKDLFGTVYLFVSSHLHSFSTCIDFGDLFVEPNILFSVLEESFNNRVKPINWHQVIFCFMIDHILG